jgi:hypothetical protein|tara:strand:- start:807 stop:983 length:177 start_codon:yes stop_codon:yes gene_type:complete
MAIKNALIEKNIIPVVKDQSESARLAGFGITAPFSQEVFVHDDEKVNAVEIIKVIIRS